MATIKDVAKQAGVSVATVSNIINHKACVSNEKYERVMQVIEELNYTPSFLARNLKNNKARLMAVIIPELNSFYGHIIRGIQQVFEKDGKSIVIKCTNYSEYQEANALAELKEVGVKGILVVYSAMKNMDQYHMLQNQSIPVVFLCGRPDSYDFSSVVFSNTEIIYDTVKKISAKKEDKKEKIALITNSHKYSEELACVEGYTKGLLEENLLGDCYCVRETKELAYIDLMEIVLNLEEIPRIFIVTSLNTAMGLKEILEKLGQKRRIYTLVGDNEYEDNTGQIISICRNTVEMGQVGSRLIMEYNNSPVYNEKNIIKIKQPIKVKENMHWGNMPTKKISILVLKGQQSKALMKLAPFFTKEFGIEIKCTRLSYEELCYKIIEENINMRDEYDIFMLDYQLFASMLNENYLLDISKYLEEDEDNFLEGFLPVAREEFIEFGKESIFTLPLLTTMQLLFYRRDLFEDENVQWRFQKKHGVELRPPRTWVEFDVIAQFFTQSINPESPVKYGVSMDGNSSISLCEQFFPRQWAYRGSLVANDKVTMNTVKNRKALLSMKTAYLCSELKESEPTFNKNGILSGEAAMCMTYATHIPCTMVDEIHRVDYSDILATNVPGNCPMLGGWSLGINKYSKNAFESYMFIKWITSNKNMENNTLLGGFSPKMIAENNEQINYVYPWIQTLLNNFQNAKKRNEILNNKGELIERYKIDALLAEEMSSMFMEENTVEEVLANLQIKIETLLEG